MDHVWQGNYLSAFIFLEDKDGNAIGMANQNYVSNGDSPLLEYCFFDNAVVTQNINTVKRPATGREHKVLVTLDKEYFMKVTNMVFKAKKETDLETLLDRRKRITVAVRFYSPFKPLDSNDEQFILKKSVMTASEINTEENSIAIGTASFTGEEFKQR